MALPLAAGTYRLDQQHSQIGFTVTHLGLTPVRGLFPDFDGVLRVGDRLPDVALTVSISMSSVQSGHPGRDEHLQLPDYFDSATHADMVFESESVSGDPDGDDERWIIDGALTIKAITRPLRLAAAMTGRRVFPLDDKERTGFLASGRLSRIAYGVAPAVPSDMLSDEIELDIAAQLIAD
jgi:polyisoprenoid-binding protein YceI